MRNLTRVERPNDDQEPSAVAVGIALRKGRFGAMIVSLSELLNENFCEKESVTFS